MDVSKKLFCRLKKSVYYFIFYVIIFGILGIIYHSFGPKFIGSILMKSYIEKLFGERVTMYTSKSRLPHTRLHCL